MLALCGAAVYAELGTMMPRVGGEYVYVSRAFGPVAGFMSGWVALIVGFAAPTAGGALGFASYVHAVVPALPQLAVAVALIVVLTAVHMIDVRFGARVQAGLAGLVVAVIVVFVVAALVTGRLALGEPGRGRSGGPARTRGAVSSRRRRVRGRPGAGVVRVFGLERRRVHRRRGPRSGAGAAARAGAAGRAS